MTHFPCAPLRTSALLGALLAAACGHGSSGAGDPASADSAGGGSAGATPVVIAQVVRETLERVPVRTPKSIGEVLEIDRESRAMARQLIAARALYSKAGIA